MEAPTTRVKADKPEHVALRRGSECTVNPQPIDKRTHITELDGIRGIAVLMVLVWHYVTCTGAGSLGRPISYFVRSTYLFWSGVDLFFVLSGFLIGGIILDSTPGPQFFKAFLIRRTTRILPVYFLMLGLFFSLRSPLANTSLGYLFESGIPDFSYLLMLQNIFMGIEGEWGAPCLAVSWSLAVEEQFYVFLPLAFLCLNKSGIKGLAVATIILIPFLRLLFPGFHVILSTPFRADSLMIGVALAALHRSPTFLRFLCDRPKALWTAVFSLLCGMAAMTIADNGREFLAPTFIAVFYAAFISAAIVYRNTRLTRVLRWKVLTQLGFYSYGIYMYHQTVAAVLHDSILNLRPNLITVNGAIVTSLSVVATVILAVLSRHLLEEPFLRFGKRFKYGDTTRVFAQRQEI